MELNAAINGEYIYLSLTTVGIDGTKNSSLSYVKLVFFRYLRSNLKDAGTETVYFESKVVVQNTARSGGRRGESSTFKVWIRFVEQGPQKNRTVSSTIPYVGASKLSPNFYFVSL